MKSKQEFLNEFRTKLDELITFYQNQAETYLTLSETCSIFTKKSETDSKTSTTNSKNLNHGLLDAQSKHAQTSKGLIFCRNKLIEFEQSKLSSAVQMLDIYEHDKYEFLSFFLKIKEMEEEENDAIYNNIPNWRLETGNYDYRMLLKAKVLLKEKFKKSRTSFIAQVDQLQIDFKKMFYDIVCLEYCAVMNRFHESLQNSDGFIDKFLDDKSSAVLVSRDNSKFQIDNEGDDSEKSDEFEKFFPKDEPSLIQF